MFALDILAVACVRLQRRYLFLLSFSTFIAFVERVSLRFYARASSLRSRFTRFTRHRCSILTLTIGKESSFKRNTLDKELEKEFILLLSVYIYI